MKNTILSVLVENNYGVVARITGLFTRRGFNLNSIAGEETHDPSISRITISVTEDEASLYQIRQQVEKLVDIKKVQVLSNEEDIMRELALIKVSLKTELFGKIKELTNDYNVKVVDMDTESIVFEICDQKDKIDSFIDFVKPFHIIESVRTGVVALQKGNNYMA